MDGPEPEQEEEEVLLIDLRSPDTTNMQILMEKLTHQTQTYNSDR